MDPAQIEGFQTYLSKTLFEFGINLAIAVAIGVVGWWIAGWVSRTTARLLDRSARFDATLKPLATNIVRQSVLIITLLMVLGRFGVETTSIIAILGAAGLAIGLALQGTLSNVAAGVMLLVLRPFGVGDSIEVGGRIGTVRQIGLFTTELNSSDNIYLSLPNSKVWNEPILNFSRNPTRRIDLVVGIDYGDDVDRAIALVMELLQADERVQAEPAPLVAVKALGASSVDLVVRGHAKVSDYWPTLFGLQKAIKQRFDAEGITIPFPQQTLHVPDEVRITREAS